MTPLQFYEQQIKQGNLQVDNAQLSIIKRMDLLYHELRAEHNLYAKMRNAFMQLLGLKYTAIKGLYLWGGVGRGKTYLMDILYNLYPYDDKARLHFHRFMQYVHQMLNEYQGKKNPLQKIAKVFSKQYKLLCFDEFFVSDIADAMCLAKLLKYMTDYGVTFVATSNLHPDDLYLNGLQRSEFLPAIALIHKRTDVVQMLGEKDWRLQQLSTLKLYYSPLNATTQQAMQKTFDLLAPHDVRENAAITVVSRSIACRYLASNAVWFDASVLLESARSAADYIEIARSFHTVFISNIGVMSESKENMARRFISLVDIFYEFHVILILSAEVPWDKLYQGRRHRFEFERIVSRLTQMQSQEYISLPHLV